MGRRRFEFSRAFGARFSRQSREQGGFAAKTTRANTIPPASQAKGAGANIARGVET